MPIYTAKTAAGVVRGVESGIPSTIVYRGVPFAQAKRFCPPEAPTPWQGERLCNTFAPILPQQQIKELLAVLPDLPFANFFAKEFYPTIEPVQEESLTLTVWTPAETQEDKLPVMVWIHGGGMATGYDYEMEFDGEALAKRGVILVSINYRLAILGHFAHPDLTKQYGTSGNWSILDQQAALRWVRDNIASFGGDPDNVTIFGQSAGGGSVVSHLCAPGSRGLFHRAIIQSGSGLMNYARGVTLDKAEDWGVRACEACGKTVEELRAMPLEEFNATMAQVVRKIGDSTRQCQDGVIFPKPFADQLRQGDTAPVPVMVGSVSGDNGLFPADPELEWHERAATYRYSGRQQEFMARFPTSDPANDALYQLLNDSGAKFWDTAICEGQRKVGRGAYLYYFHPYIPGGDEFGFVPDGTAYHSAELWYVFGTLGRCWRPFDGRHYDLSNRIMDYWTNFARTGDPNGEGLPKWKRYDDANQSCIDLTETAISETPIPQELQMLAAF